MDLIACFAATWLAVAAAGCCSFNTGRSAIPKPAARIRSRNIGLSQGRRFRVGRRRRLDSHRDSTAATEQGFSGDLDQPRPERPAAGDRRIRARNARFSAVTLRERRSRGPRLPTLYKMAARHGAGSGTALDSSMRSPATTNRLCCPVHGITSLRAR